MLVHEKIRFFRQAKGWTQEDIAHKLEMSPNGYGCIERGDTDINLSRLEKIADLFKIQLSELFDFDGKNIFNLMGDLGTQNNQVHCQVDSYSQDYQHLKGEIEKKQLLVEQQTKEILYLKEIIELMKKEKS